MGNEDEGTMETYKNICNNLGCEIEKGINFSDFLAATIDKEKFITK